jgi:hypothetical protein
MSKFLSGREREFKIGISSFTENKTVLEVIGNSNFTGVVTASSFNGSGVNLTGIVTSIVAGSNITISGSTGEVTINASSTGGGESYWSQTEVGIHTLSNVGIGTTNPTSKLTIDGDGYFTGVVTSSNFSGNASTATYASTAGVATTANNLSDAANITTGTINSARLSGTYNIDINGNASTATYASTAGIATNATYATYATSSDIATYATSAGIATYASTAGIATNATYAISSGIATYASTAGIATNATKLQTARTFEITGDVVSSAISFDGSGNVSLAATIQPNSVALGSDTTGDYVSNITGTSNQITVTSGTGEGSTPTLSIPNQFTVPQDIIVTRDLQVNRNLNVTGNITIGGTAAFIDAAELRVSDPDIVLGFRTDSNGNENTTDNTANHGGVAVASTEGTPLVNLFIAGIETNPVTYKKIMWFKAGTFAGLGTDAWISNYAIGIGSTQVPNGVRLAAGGMQVTDSTVSTPQLSVSGIITATGGFNLGISSSGTPITSGPVTTLNFIGAGNTFAVNGTTVDISIVGGGGGGASVSISTTPPTSPNEGDLWYSSILGRTFIYYVDEDSSQWVDAAPFNPTEPPSTPGKTSSSFTATEGQTSFSVSYTVGYIDVFLNGVRLNSSEFTASNGSSVNLIEGATAGDVLDVVEYRMGIGDTGAAGATGAGGPLSNITQTTSSSTFYPVIAIGTGSTLPYITTTSNYFEFTPSSGTLEVNQLVVAGVTTSTDFNATSDINLKENISIIEDPLEKLVGISGVTFNWKESKESSAGVIAQDVEKVLPEIVKSNDDMKTVNYNGLIGLLVEAVKNQQDQINSLTERIKSLEGN